ncbi:hypothetical protein Q3G72_030045 [Acer saccharum]|nr:hypothetical protein Q3G72_030045 [Acer saccharum]
MKTTAVEGAECNIITDYTSKEMLQNAAKSFNVDPKKYWGNSTDLIRRNQQLLDSIANCRNKTTVLYLIDEIAAGIFSALPYALAQVRRKDFNYKNVILTETLKLVSFSV